MNEQTEVGIITGLLGAFGYVLGHIVARKKNKVELEGKELENATVAIGIWRDLYEQLQVSVNKLMTEVNELRHENEKLRKQIFELKRLIKQQK